MSETAENEEKLSFAQSFVKGLGDFKNGLSMTGGDWGSVCQLFFDNLSTLLGAVFALQALSNPAAFGDIAVSQDTMNEYVWGKIVPGVGMTMVLGNLYYTWQAIRMTMKYGRQYTAQPYGLNTPGAFAFVYNIIYTVFFSEGGGDAGFIQGYKVALAANFVTGLISMVLGIFGMLILKVVPPAGLLVPIASIGFAFLGLEQLSNSIAAPIVGYSTIMWVYLGWYANIRIGYGKFRLPEALQVILVGIILGWATGLNSPEATKEAAKLVKWWGPTWTAGDTFADFNLLADYLGIVIPLGISAAATSLMCLVSAKEAGDPYPVRESLIVDGIGTCIASFFGSPFGTVLYIGHPAYKRSGAKVGYSLVNGVIYLICSWFGILALIQSIVNPATIGPIVFFVGLQVNEEALNFLPNRHYSAYIIGLFPSVYDWVTNIANRAPLLSEDGSYDTNSTGASSWVGVLAWKRGALLVSLLWTSMVVNILDRQWRGAAIWAIVSSLFAIFGIIHVPEAGFDNFTSPFWEQCSGPDQCWDFAEQWMFAVAYLMLAGYFIIIFLSAKAGADLDEPIDDESRHAFDDWFKDAYMYKDEHGNMVDSRNPTGTLAEADDKLKDPDTTDPPVTPADKVDEAAEEAAEEAAA